jgi:hypothetical protein
MLKADYLKNPDGNHVEYYRQFATPQVMTAVRKHFGQALQDQDFPFNNTDIHMWAQLAYIVPATLFRLVGDFPTLDGKIRTLKVAALLIKREGVRASERF